MDPGLKTGFARFVLANSITLTPGTITIEITEDGIYSVHALTGELKEGLLDGSMQQKVAWLYKETINFSPVSAEEAKFRVSAGRPALVRKGYSRGRKKL